MKKLSLFAVLFWAAVVCSAWAMEAIQTQMSTDGNFDVSLIRAKVSKDVLTVQVLFKNTSSTKRFYSFDFRNVYYTDTKDKKKYYGLKDSEGHYIAGPAFNWLRGGKLNVYVAPGDKLIFWIKFPAPPEATESIDIYIPWALPFEDVKIQR